MSSDIFKNIFTGLKGCAKMNLYERCDVYMELKKSYKGLVIWFIFFTVTFLLLTFLKINDTALVARIGMNIMTFYVAILAYIIYKTGYVYWYNGITYEEACEVGEERRKLCALRHFQRLGLCAAFYFVFSVVAHLLNIPYGVDIAVATVSIIVAAFSTISIKL